MKKPASESARISMAMGYCPDCQRPFITNEVKHVGAAPSNGCRSDGHEYECKKGKPNGRYARAAWR